MNEKILLSLQGKMIACRLCITEGFNIEPGAVFSGSAEAEVMLIGQAPGITEVTAKRPFNARRRPYMRSKHHLTVMTSSYWHQR